VVRKAVTVAVFDFLALAFLYSILQDLSWRASYAKSENLTPRTDYSLFFRVLTITGNAIQIPKGLVSPPTLDWVQVVVALLVIVNGFYAFSTLRRSPMRREQA
jgi:hypothetical protein